jgi:hypothetical protein
MFKNMYICIGNYGNNTPSGSMYSPAHPTSPGGVSVAESHFSTTSHNYGGSSSNHSQQQQQLQPRIGSTVSTCTYNAVTIVNNGVNCVSSSK